MLSVQGVVVPYSRETRTLSIVQPLRRFQNYTSSTRSMPVEVVSNIFGLVSHSSPDPTSQSVSISHVCRRWRQIALSMPSLWNSIFLSFPLTKSQLVRTTTWMIRSRNYPLDIYMDFRDPSWDWDEVSHVFGPKAMDNIVRFLAPYASRWRSIELLTDTWAPIHTFLSCTVAIDSVPLLQKVRIARCNEYFVAQGETFQPADLALPIPWFKGGSGLSNLRHVSLSGVHVDWTQSGLAGLRELELKYHARDVMPTPSEFRHILYANPGLERLVILGWSTRVDYAFKDERGCDSLQRIDLPRLEELDFGFVDVAYATDLLSLFILPNLRTLSLEDVAFGIQLYERQDCSRLIDRLVEMSAKGQMSLPSLRVLSLRSIHAGDASIVGLFRQLCAVRSLCLDRIDAASLSVVCSTIRVCDRLEALTLKDIDPAMVGLVLSSHSFPPRLRIFLDIEEVDQDEEDDQRDIGALNDNS